LAASTAQKAAESSVNDSSEQNIAIGQPMSMPDDKSNLISLKNETFD